MSRKELQENDPKVALVRSNKVTAYWKGEGVAVGVFYRTHDKISEVASTDEVVIATGFKFAEGTDEAPITAQQKLEAFKIFLTVNASTFGILYDPVDRRADEFKFPNKYDASNVLEFSKKMLDKIIGESLEKVQNNVITNMVKAGHLAEGTQVQFGIGDGTSEITESYGDGSIKYATVTYPVVFAVAGNNYETTGIVTVVSGQLKKPRELADTVAITMTGIKTLLIEKGLLPKIEKPVATAEVADETATTEESAGQAE
jgi:hypothetical protein